MAQLSARTADVEFLLRPVKVVESGEPTWIQMQLQLLSHGSQILSSTQAITVDDLVDIPNYLRSVMDGTAPKAAWESTDADFIIQVHKAHSPGDAIMAIWTGEPYNLMKGFRFVVRAADLREFASQLELDRATFGGAVEQA